MNETERQDEMNETEEQDEIREQIQKLTLMYKMKRALDKLQEIIEEQNQKKVVNVKIEFLFEEEEKGENENV